MAQGLPEFVLQYKANGDCEAVREYVVSNDISLFHYRSCIAQHRGAFLEDALENLDCDGIERLAVSEDDISMLFQCRAKLASSTQDFDIHWRSYTEQKALYLSNRFSAEAFLIIADDIHQAAVATNDTDLIEFSSKHLEDVTETAVRSFEREEARRFAEIQQNVAAEVMGTYLADLRDVWDGSTMFFSEHREGYPNYHTYTNFLTFDQRANGQDLCKIEIEEQQTLYSVSDDAWLLSKVAIWEIDLLEYIRYVRSADDRYVFTLLFSEYLTFSQAAGVTVTRCTSESAPGFPDFESSCSEKPFLRVSPDEREDLQESFFSVMNACFVSFGKG